MRAFRSWLGFLGILSLAGLPGSARAQAVGSEFQVNTYTTSNQTTGFFAGGRHLVAGDASGNFVVVWSSYHQDGDG